MELNYESNEPERLTGFKSSRIIDTLPEASFEQLTVLAARVCEAPIALLSFIDEKRQWFKSSFGMEGKEIPIQLTSSNEMIYLDGIYEIPDGSLEDFPLREFMNKHRLHFYAAVPIISTDGHWLGTLCVIDYVVRKLSHEQAITLKTIGSQIVENLEIRRKYQENLERLKELDNQMIVHDKKLMDWAYKKSHKAIAEMASGLNYRLRPFLLNIKSNVSLLSRIDMSIEDKERLKSVSESANNVDTILKNLEKFVVAEKEKWMKVVEINTILKDLLSHADKELKDKNIELEVNMELELRCLGNYAKLSEAFHAVIFNAIEAIGDRKEGKIIIELQQEDRKAIIYIKDNGSGVGEMVKPFLFQPFFTTKNHANIGIGLALAKSHLEEHGGTIELMNSYDPTIFKITIPIPL